MNKANDGSDLASVNVVCAIQGKTVTISTNDCIIAVSGNVATVKVKCTCGREHIFASAVPIR